MKGRSRKAGHKRIFTMPRQKKKRGKKVLFLLLPCLSAWVESIHVDHDLPSEDALAVVDRDRVCDGSHSYSIEIDKGGAMRGSQPPSLVFLLTLLTVFILSTLTSKRYVELIKLSCQLKCNNVLGALTFFSPSDNT